jgi:pyruvate/2-oxoglutarate dehydrogenase complex dihydrolipoamide acyltransferase (E2) component
MFSRGSHQRRIAWTGLTFLMIGQFLITLPSPLSVEVPVVARFSGDQVLRAPASGFVRHVFHESGQVVRTGEVILEIENEELKVKRDEIVFELEAEKIKWQLNEQQSALGLAEASVQRSESMKRKLAELDDQVAAMRVKAAQDGEILTPRLVQLVNDYVTHGDELVQIGNRDHKELLISIGEDEMDAYRQAIENAETMRVCFRSGQWVDIELQPIRPRGSRLVSHPALAATAGGPIPVTPKHDEQAGSSSVQWLSPRFEAIVPLPPSQADLVHCGEVGMLALQDQRSLARRFWQWLKSDNAR